MFFMVSLEKRMHVHPRFFTASLKDTLKDRLMLEVEGTSAGSKGFILKVAEVEEPVPPGLLDEVTGNAIFPLRYQALVFRPYKGEVLDAIVARVMTPGLYAEAGPMTIFVSRQQLPDDMSFDASAECWRSVGEAQQERIEKGSSVRLRIIGMKIEINGFFAIGTLDDHYLGVV
mmetsp:Transcript_8813/g.17807  ORF Transcript_8813/g.17807 Transcript_8813/m.17807 type:complete len:173 (-) Transcript_8813:286-804(-)